MGDRLVELAERLRMPHAVAAREYQGYREEREQRHENARENHDLRSMWNRCCRPASEWDRLDVCGCASQVVEQPIEIRPALKIVVARALHAREQGCVAVYALGLVALRKPYIEYVNGAASEFEPNQDRRVRMNRILIAGG